MKRTKLKRYTPLRANTGLKAKKGLNRVSVKTAKANKKWLGIVLKLAEETGYTCEICHKYIGFVGEFGLSGHHIIPRSKGRIDTEENCLITCMNCHDHDKYASTQGMPITIEEARRIVANRRRQNGL